jgi:hypothetical protein
MQKTDNLEYQDHHWIIVGKLYSIQLTKTYMQSLNSITSIEAGDRCNTSNVSKNCVDAMNKIPAQNNILMKKL